MKKRLITLAILATGASSFASAPALGVGGTPCAHYSVTAPIVGTRSDQRCGVPLPDAFDFPVGASNCGGIPPVGVAWCVGGTVYIVNG